MEPERRSLRRRRSRRNGAGAAEDEGLPPEGDREEPPPRAAAAPRTRNAGGPRANKQTCASCRISRIRCSGDFPCARCFRLSLHCRPQVRMPRRSPTTKDGPYALMPSLEAHPLRHQLVDAIFSRADPRALADVYMQALALHRSEGLVDREQALHAARWWYLQSAATGSDASWGFLAELARTCGFSQVDLEPPDWLPHGGPHAQRQQQAQELLQAAIGHIPALEQNPAFRRADYGGAAVVIGQPTAAAPGFAEASNQVCRELFRGSEELLGPDLAAHRTLGSILMLGILAPDDRLAFTRMIVERLFTRSTRLVTCLTKIFNRKGEIKLYLLSAKPLQILPDGRPSGYIFRIEACPPSRHVTTAPGHAARASTFRQVSRLLPPSPLPPPPPTPRASAVEGAAERITVPGTAALPVPPPPLLTSNDEARLLQERGQQLYPPLAGPVAPPCPLPLLALPSAGSRVAGAVEEGKESEQRLQHAQPHQRARKKRARGAAAASSEVRPGGDDLGPSIGGVGGLLEGSEEGGDPDADVLPLSSLDEEEAALLQSLYD